MIISRTPFRVSLFGGGTDYPQWFNEHGGAVLGMAIDKYCYVSLRKLPPFFEHLSRIVYSKVETVAFNSQIEHPVVRALLERYGINYGVEIHHDADLPAKSGMGSSSAFVVGLLTALYQHLNVNISPVFTALVATNVEQKQLNESVGCQDQLWASRGGFARLKFDTGGFSGADPLPNRAIAQNLLLVFTGFSRFASGFAKDQIDNFKQREKHLQRMRAMVDEAHDYLVTPRESFDLIGEMLHETWMLKRELADTVSRPMIDSIYDLGRSAGATGGKLLGAGGGGFMLFYVEPEKRQAVKDVLKPLICVDFEIDDDGSKIVLNHQE